MTPQPYISIANLKKFSKLVKTRFAIKLSLAQESLCRASGYRSLNDLYRNLDRQQLLPRAVTDDYETWRRRLGFELGSDRDALLSEDEQETWFRQIHGIPVARELADQDTQWD